jgi:putative ATPase
VKYTKPAYRSDRKRLSRQQNLSLLFAGHLFVILIVVICLCGFVFIFVQILIVRLFLVFIIVAGRASANRAHLAIARFAELCHFIAALSADSHKEGEGGWGQCKNGAGLLQTISRRKFFPRMVVAAESDYDGQPMTNEAPIAYRLRPELLQEFVGQEHIVGEGTALRTAIEQDKLSSVILSGPPGSGKTTLARIVANATKANFVQINAVMSGVKELKEVCIEAERMKSTFGQRTVLFIDEIHRFNKSQQDALLPFVEAGSVILIGATTENPYFEVNAALVSRSHVYLLQPHSKEDLLRILKRAVWDEKGFGGKVKVAPEVLDRIAVIANGDARIALNALELAAITSKGEVTAEEADKLFREKFKRYDRSGEEHYNTISAFIKTLRGSDPDAALVWMYKMIQSGEEPRFLFRRMAIFASEDIGNADPNAVQFVSSAWDAFERVGYPEGEYFLAHACIYLAQAPKSNAVKRAMHSVKDAISGQPTLEVPNHLRNAPIKGMADQGYGKGYQYPHDAEGGVVRENYFPIGMPPRPFYAPTDRGFEAEVKERLEKARGIVRGE